MFSLNGFITKAAQSLNYDMPYFSISSLHCLCVAKQAIAHILISTPVWNCFPRMSQTPWLGVATVLFCRKKKHSNIHVSESKELRYLLLQNKRKQSLQSKLRSLFCTRQPKGLKQPTHVGNRASALGTEAKRRGAELTRPPYCSIGAGSTRPVTWAISSRTLNWNSWTNGSAS